VGKQVREWKTAWHTMRIIFKISLNEESNIFIKIIVIDPWNMGTYLKESGLCYKLYLMKKAPFTLCESMQPAGLMLWVWRERRRWDENPAMLFTIKKRINTELFIDKRAALLYIENEWKYKNQDSSLLQNDSNGNVK